MNYICGVILTLWAVKSLELLSAGVRSRGRRIPGTRDGSRGRSGCAYLIQPQNSTPHNAREITFAFSILALGWSRGAVFFWGGGSTLDQNLWFSIHEPLFVFEVSE